MRILKDANKKYCFIMDMRVGVPNQGNDAVVRKIEVEYKTSLRGGDTFISSLRLERKGPRFIFHQDIIRSDGEMCAEGVVTVVVLKDGKLSRGDELAKVFGRSIQ